MQQKSNKAFRREAHADSSMQCYPTNCPALLCGQLGIMQMDRAYKYLHLNGSDNEGTLVPSSVSIIWKTTNHIPSCFQIIAQQHASNFTSTNATDLLRSWSFVLFVCFLLLATLM